MDRFLASLSPSLRGQVEAAISDPESRSRLEWVVSRYIDEDGNWPTGPTAQTLAQTFLHQQSDYDGQRFGAAGLGQTTVAALAGGALAIGGGTALQTVASGLVANYWADALAYSTGLNPQFIRQIKKVFDQVAADTSWAMITEGLADPQPTAIDRVLDTFIADRLAKKMERSLYGVFKQAAWRGARSGLYHTTGLTIGDASQENAWVEQYVRNFAQNQEGMARRTVTSIVNDALERGHGSRAIADRLEMLWNLTPRHAQAVENYRRGLLEKEVPARRARDLAGRYASRLHASRLKSLSQSEMHTAFNLGREAQWVKAVQDGTLPIDTMKMWITAQDEAVCPVCRPLDGVTTELGSTFESSINIYVPGAHPNCRCIVVPVSARSTADMSRKRTLIFPARESVSKKMIVIDAYEREDGTPVRRHTRVIGEKSAYEQWKDAPATEHHKKIASFLNSYKFPDMPEREELLPKPSSFPKRPDTRADAPDWGEQLSAYSDALGRFWGSTEGRKFKRQLDVAERRWSNQAAKEALDSAPGVDQSVLKSTLFGSRVWTTQSDGVGLVRHVAGMTDYPGHREVDPTQFRESKIRAASNFMNTVRSAPKTNATIYRGINVDDDNYIENLKRGGTLSLPVSSFTDSKEQARHFAGGGGIPVVFEVSGGVNALRLPDLLSNRRYSESEWVTSGSFTIEDVKPPVSGAGWLLNTAVVTLSQNVSKVHSDHREIEDLLCTPLPREKSVSKHLIGRHDQKKHGKKGHGRDDHKGLRASWSDGAVAAMAGAGLMALTRRPPGFLIQPLYMRSSSRYASIAEDMKKGIDPNKPWVTHLAIDLKVALYPYREAYISGRFNRQQGRLAMLLANAPEIGRPLYRGMTSTSEEVFNSYQAGRKITLGPSSFTMTRDVASDYASHGISGKRVMFHADGKTRGLDIDAFRSGKGMDDFVPNLEEVVTTGEFIIDRVMDVGDMRHVYLRQTGMLAPGTNVSYLAKRDELDKRLIRVKEYEREDGTVVEEHFRNLPGADRSEDLRKLKTGAYDMPLSWLKSHVRGSGIRLGQRNRIRTLANSILDEGFTKPITMWIYDDGPFIKDGMHRLEAANLLGLDRIPVGIKHVEGTKPERDLRGHLAARRIRRQTPEHKRETPFKNVRQEENFVRWFNERMSGRGERLAHDDEPKRRRALFIGKSDSPVLYIETTQRFIRENV